MPVSEVNIGVRLPFFEVGTTWVPNDAERDAAWALLVEMVTRTAVAPLRRNEGVLREALDSIHSLFAVTREVLRSHGPEVARDKGDGNPSLATVAAVILNGVIRPMLSTWHPRLADYEAKRPPGTGVPAWERKWEHYEELRQALNDTRQLIRNYVEVLGDAAQATEFAAAAVSSRSDE